MVRNSAKLDRRTKQHTEFGVSASNGSRDMARTKVAEKKKKRKKKKMNIDNPIKHPLRGSLITDINILSPFHPIVKITVVLNQFLGEEPFHNFTNRQIN